MRLINHRQKNFKNKGPATDSMGVLLGGSCGVALVDEVVGYHKTITKKADIAPTYTLST